MGTPWYIKEYQSVAISVTKEVTRSIYRTCYFYCTLRWRSRFTLSRWVWLGGGEDLLHKEGRSRRQQGPPLLPFEGHFYSFQGNAYLKIFNHQHICTFALHSFASFASWPMTNERQPVSCCQGTLHCCCSAPSSATRSVRWIFSFAVTCMIMIKAHCKRFF